MNERIKVYSVEEIATILKTTRQQVRKMIQNEELPAVKVGREWRITEESLQEFLGEGRQSCVNAKKQQQLTMSFSPRNR